LSVRIAFLGPPGAGKGTQARDLAQEWGVLHLATGDMLREAVAAGSPLGREAKDYMDRGALVPDDVIIRMMGERLGRADARRGFILDGFPRTIAQAEALGTLLKDLGLTLDTVVYFDVSEPELLRRLTGRRVCRKCGHTYHLVSNPPKRPGVCDACGGELYQREDDSEATVRNRLDVYRRQTSPLLDYYRQRQMLTTVSGEGPVATIRDAIRTAATGAAR
jgi:adenylate kinase